MAHPSLSSAVDRIAPIATVRQVLRAGLRIALAGLVLTQTPAGAAALPRAALAEAEGLAALPGGGWLALEERALRLLDASGRERARLAVRGEHLDTRDGPGGTLAMLIDADTQQTLRVSVDESAGSLRSEPVVASPSYSVQAMCMHRDAQGLDHVFVIGDEGLVEQWLLRTGAPSLLMRRSAVAPQARACRVDDRAALLYVNAEDSGLWAYRADAEGPPARHAVALARPLGMLEGGAAAFAVLPGGVAVLEGSGRRMHLLHREGAARWRAAKALAVQSTGEVEAMATRLHDGGIELFWRDESAAGWQARRVPWTRAADAGLAAPLPIVLPSVATDVVNRFGDAADDPAIWVHPSAPERSLVLGTNKRAGLHVYDLQGRERQFLASGRINNVDVRQGVRLGGQVMDLAVGTQRDDLSLVVYRFDGEGRVEEIGRVPTDLKNIYGTCLHQPLAGGLEVIVNDQDGRFERWRLHWQDGRIGGTRIQRFAVKTQPEGCVVDDAAERLFIGEETVAVWTLSLAPAAGLGAQPKLEKVIGVGGMVEADIEGLALHDGGGAGERYLIVSSQGNDSYVVLDAAPPYRVRGAFRIGLDAQRGIDGVSETDGIDATARPLGPAFPRGVFVAQDGFKRLPDGPQNYKIVDWRDIARALGLP
jgi:3-phytase